jgi:hypothetical protein
MKGLFGGLPLQMFQERQLEFGQLQGEIWRLFVFAMLLFLIAEAILVLPAKDSGRPAPAKPAKKTPEPEEQLV